MGCDFCGKPRPDDLIYKTKHWKILLADDQIYVGRSIIVLDRHCEDLADITMDEWTDFIPIVSKLEHAYRNAFNATMFNWTCLMNHEYKQKEPHPHLHWHLRPRYNHVVSVGDRIFKDNAFGHHYDRELEFAEGKISLNIRKNIVDELKKYV